MGVDYFELVRKALEYLEVIGGICAFCENAEIIYVNGSVKCKTLGDLAKPALRCVHYTSRVRTEFLKAIEALSGTQGEERKRGFNRRGDSNGVRGQGNMLR